MEANEYRCEMCGEVFKKGWSDEQAKEEYKKNFNMEVKEDDGIVCDDCYNKMMVEIDIGRPSDWHKKLFESYNLIGAVGMKVYIDENNIVRTEILHPDETLEWLDKINSGEILPDNIQISQPTNP